MLWYFTRSTPHSYAWQARSSRQFSAFRNAQAQPRSTFQCTTTTRLQDLNHSSGQRAMEEFYTKHSIINIRTHLNTQIHFRIRNRTSC